MIENVEFEAWLATLCPDDSLRAVAAKSGIPVNTLSVQMTKSRIPASTVLSIADAYDRPAWAELKKFTAYEQIPTHSLARQDVLLLVPTLTVFRALLIQAGDSELSPWQRVHISDDSLSRWVDRYGTDYSRKGLADAVGMDAPNFSRQIHQRSLNFDRCVRLGDVLGADVRVPLLACSHLRFEWVSPLSLEDVVGQCSMSDLVTEVSSSQKYLMKDIVRLEE